MKIYVLPPESIERAKRKALIRSLVFSGFTLPLALVGPVTAGFISVGALVIVIPIIMATIVIGFRRGFKILDENLKSYQLLVSSDSVVKRQCNLPDVEIHREQITRVDEKPGTGLFIRTVDKRSFINVPEGLEGMNELKETLSEWRPSDSIISSEERGPLLFWGALILFGLALITLWLSTNLALVIAAGLYLTILMILSFVLQRRRHVDPRTKLKPWLFLVLVLVYGIILYARATVLLKH
jgi:hypothetical protein